MQQLLRRACHAANLARERGIALNTLRPRLHAQFEQSGRTRRPHDEGQAENLRRLPLHRDAPSLAPLACTPRARQPSLRLPVQSRAQLFDWLVVGQVVPVNPAASVADGN
jgi:hypothetical protein